MMQSELKQMIKAIPPVRPEDFTDGTNPDPGYRRIEHILEQIGLTAAMPTPIEALLHNLGVLRQVPDQATWESNGFAYPSTVLRAYGWEGDRSGTYEHNPALAAAAFERIRRVLLETTDAREILRRACAHAVT